MGIDPVHHHTCATPNSPDALCTRFSVENEATQERMHYTIQDTPGYGDDTVRFWFGVDVLRYKDAMLRDNNNHPPSYTHATSCTPQDITKSIDMVLSHVEACNARCVPAPCPTLGIRIDMTHIHLPFLAPQHHHSYLERETDAARMEPMAAQEDPRVRFYLLLDVALGPRL